MVGDADGGTRQAAAGGVRLVLSRSRSRRCDTGAWGLAAGSRDAAVAAGGVPGAWGSGSGIVRPGGRRTPPGCLRLCDGALPWCMGFCLCLQRGALFGSAEAGREVRRQQIRRDVAEVDDRVLGDLPVAAQADQVAVSCTDFGAVVPVDGAGNAEAGQAFPGARAGAAPAMHAAAKLASDGRRAARAAGAGAGATARGESEVGVAAADLCFGGGRRWDFGGHGSDLRAVFAFCSYTLPVVGEATALSTPPIPVRRPQTPSAAHSPCPARSSRSPSARGEIRCGCPHCRSRLPWRFASESLAPRGECLAPRLHRPELSASQIVDRARQGRCVGQPHQPICHIAREDKVSAPCRAKHRLLAASRALQRLQHRR